MRFYVIFSLLCVLLHVSDVCAGVSGWSFPSMCDGPELDERMRCLCSDIDVAVSTGEQYTIDRRTVVSESEWANNSPYIHVLKAGEYKRGKWETFCTANMIQGKIVTAQQCYASVSNVCLDSDKNYLFQDVDGRVIVARAVACGTGGALNTHTDWIVFVPVDEAGRGVVDSKSGRVVSDGSQFVGRPVLSVGFGGLKVLSDAEIENIMVAYVAFLRLSGFNASVVRSFNVDTTYGLGFLEDMRGSTECRQWFLNDRSKYERNCLNGRGEYRYSGLNYAGCGLDYFDIFDDREAMKASMGATGARAGELEYSQIWIGDAGGGVYLESDKSLIGVLNGLSGDLHVGGKTHAGRGLVLYTPARHFSRDLSGNYDLVVSGAPAFDGRVLGAPCLDEDLPENALEGIYQHGLKENLSCGSEKCKCVAVRCREGYRVFLEGCTDKFGG